jgi:hypothetical protein
VTLGCRHGARGGNTLHLTFTTFRFAQPLPLFWLSLLAACELVQPAPRWRPAPLQTDQLRYVLGYGVWSAPMRVCYTNPRSDTVYFLLACGGRAPTPDRYAERVDITGRSVFVENLACPANSAVVPPAIAVAPGKTYVDSTWLRVSEWAEGDSAGSVAAIVGHFVLVYNLCVATNAEASSTGCHTLAHEERVTNVFNVVAPTR